MTRMIVLALALAAYPFQASALPIEVSRRDMKLATQQLVEKQTVSAPDAALATHVLSAHAGDTGAGGVQVTSFAAQPDVPRNLTVTPSGTTADVRAGSVIIYGTDYLNASIMEVFAITDNQATATTGNLAFRSVTKVILPTEDSPFGATWGVGIGTKLGLKNCMAKVGHLVFATFGGVYEATRPTMAVGASVGQNTAILASSLDGSSDAELFFLQNFLCL